MLRYFRAVIRVGLFVVCLCPVQGASAYLTWYPNSESDLSGYRVYRSETSGSGYALLTGSLLSSPSYTDSAVVAGHSYYYVVTAVNSSLLESPFSEQVSITIGVPNQVPTANAGPDKTVCSSAYLTISGKGTDPEGDPISLRWTQTAGPAVAMEGADSSILSFRAPSVAASLRFRLTVTDGNGGSASDEVLVSVISGVNYPPVADAGVDRLAVSGQKAKLIGTGSDPNGDKVTFSWQQRSGPTVTLMDAATPIAYFTAPTVTTTATMIFRLTVRDPQGASNYDEVRVFVNPTDSMNVAFPSSTQGINALLDNNSVGYSFTNFGTTASAVDFAAVDATGKRTSLGSVVVKPASQQLLSASSLGIPAGSVLRAASTNPKIKSMFLVGNADQVRNDGLGSEMVPASVLHFPGASLGRPEGSMLLLANPDLTQSVDVTLRLYGADGTSLKEAVITLPANGARQASLAALLGAIPAPDQGYYLRVSGTRLVEALLVQADSDSLVTAPPQVLNPSSRLWIPHFVVGLAGEDTDLCIVNDAPQPIRVRVAAFTGSTKLAERDTTISGKGLLNARVSSFFPLSSILAGKSTASGYMTIQVIYPDPASTGQKPPLAASIRLLGVGKKAKVVLPLVAVGRRDNALLHLTQQTVPGTFTGIAILNTGTTAASVRVDAFNAAGTLTASKTVSVAAGRRFEESLNSTPLFGSAFQQVGGYLKVTGTDLLVTFAVFGDTSGEYLGAIDSQKP